MPRGYQLRLLHQRGTVLTHSVHHTHGSGASEAGLGLAGHQQRVHEGLGVVLANAHQQVVDEAAHGLYCGVDACYHLQIRWEEAELTCICGVDVRCEM